jgi:hypothetical protein
MSPHDSVNSPHSFFLLSSYIFHGVRSGGVPSILGGSFMVACDDALSSRDGSMDFFF